MATRLRHTRLGRAGAPRCSARRRKAGGAGGAAGGLPLLRGIFLVLLALSPSDVGAARGRRTLSVQDVISAAQAADGAAHGASSSSAASKFTLQTAPTTEIMVAALMPSYPKIAGLAGNRAMFIGREATGKFFVSEVDLDALRPVSFHWMQDIGLPIPPDVTIISSAGATRRIAYPLPQFFGPEETAYLSAYPELLQNLTSNVRLLAGVQALLQGDLVTGLDDSVVQAYLAIKNENQASLRERLATAAGKGPARRRRLSADSGGPSAEDAIAAGFARVAGVAYRDLMGGAMDFAEVLMDPSLSGYYRAENGTGPVRYSRELALQQAQRVILASTAFTGRVRNIGATALFSNLYFAHFYTNRRKARPAPAPSLSPGQRLRSSPLTPVDAADALRLAPASASGIFGVSDAKPPPRGSSFSKWETYQRKALYQLTLGGIGCSFEEDYVVESLSGQASPGGSLEGYDVQYFAFEGRGMALYSSKLARPSCLNVDTGCPRAEAASDLPEAAVLDVAARLRGLRPEALDYGLASTIRLLYTGQGAAAGASLSGEDLTAVGGGGAGAGGGSAALLDEPLATPPPSFDAFQYYSSGAGLTSSSSCFGTSMGGGTCGGVSSPTSLVTLGLSEEGGSVFTGLDEGSPSSTSSLGTNYDPYVANTDYLMLQTPYCCCLELQRCALIEECYRGCYGGTQYAEATCGTGCDLPPQSSLTYNVPMLAQADAPAVPTSAGSQLGLAGREAPGAALFNTSSGLKYAVFGGFDGSYGSAFDAYHPSVIVYDIDSNVWSVAPATLPSAVLLLACAWDENPAGYIYCSGGYGPDPAAGSSSSLAGVTDFYRFDVGLSAREDLPPLPEARWMHCMTVHAGQVYVTTGTTSSFGGADMQRFDGSQWIAVPDLTLPYGGPDISCARIGSRWYLSFPSANKMNVQFAGTVTAAITTILFVDLASTAPLQWVQVAQDAPLGAVEHAIAGCYTHLLLIPKNAQHMLLDPSTGLIVDSTNGNGQVSAYGDMIQSARFGYGSDWRSCIAVVSHGAQPTYVQPTGWPPATFRANAIVSPPRAPAPTPGSVQRKTQRHRRSALQLQPAMADAEFVDRAHWYLPTYSLRYCPGSGSLPLPLDAFSDSLAFFGNVLVKFGHLVPPGYSTNPFPMYPSGLFKYWAVSYPPVPTVQTLVAGPRVNVSDPSSPLRVAGIVRFPLFPGAAALGVAPAELPLLSDPARRSDIPLAGAVHHLTLRLAWLVHPPATLDVKDRGRPVLDAADVVHSAALHLDDQFVAVNAVPRYGSAGYGALEGRFVDGARFGFYVVGDVVVRFRRPADPGGGEGERSAIGGEIVDRLNMTEAAGWSPSRRRWYSVGAAALQGGALFIAREIMEAPDGPGLAGDTVDPDVVGRKVDFSGPFVKGAQLLKVFGAEAAAMGPVVVVNGFTTGVRGVLAPEEGSNATANAALGRRLFFYTTKPPEVLAVRTDCPAGTLYWHADGACVGLAPGYSSNRTGLVNITEAAVCGANTFAEGGATACSPCPKGTYSEPGASACTSCPQNTFGVDAGAGCRPCANNSYTPTLGWTSPCLTCPASEYLHVGQAGIAICLKCPPFEFSTGGAVGGCSKCPDGTITTDGTGCEGCPAGTFQPVGLPYCSACPSGTYSLAGQRNCSRCPLGYTASEDARSCIGCSEGTYMPDGSAACQRCPENTYADRTGMAGNCTACPAGTTASLDRRSCDPCPVSFYRAADMSACDKCPSGTFNSRFGAGACTPCAPGTISREDGLSCTAALDLLSECPAGRAPSADGSACEACPDGSFAERLSTPFCSACPPGHVSNGQRTACTPCAPGQYLPGNSTACATCPVNSVSSTLAALACSVCALGSVSDPTSTQCTLCPPGTFRGSANQTLCAPCGSGTYQPDYGSTECLPCPANTLCPLATVKPLALGSGGGFGSSLEISEAAAPAAARSLRELEAGGPRAPGRGRWRALLAESDDTQSATVLYGTLNATVTEPQIKDETEANKLLTQRFIIVGSAALVIFILLGLLLYAWVWLLNSKIIGLTINQRVKKVVRLHYFYREEGQKRTISGAFFTLLGAAAVFLAVSFTVAQQLTANFIVTQSLNPGVSPSLNNIQGEYGVVAGFRGYAGPCRAGLDARVTPVGITASAGSAVIRSGRSADGLTCIVSYACKSCRLANTEARTSAGFLVELAPPWASPLTLATAAVVQFAVRLPGETSINGTAATSDAARVFRGEGDVRVPVRPGAKKKLRRS
eukprot:tig00021179_g19262.t1